MWRPAVNGARAGCRKRAKIWGAWIHLDRPAHKPHIRARMIASTRIRHAAASLHSSAPARVSPVPRSVACMASGPEKRVLVPIADGSEEMEAVITIDVLRRAGAQVTVASLKDSLEIKGSRGINIVADKLISDVQGDSFDLIACPVSCCGAWSGVQCADQRMAPHPAWPPYTSSSQGGMPGAEHMRDSAILEKMVKSQRDAGGGSLSSPSLYLSPFPFTSLCMQTPSDPPL
jgi:hypothetical protein